MLGVHRRVLRAGGRPSPLGGWGSHTLLFMGALLLIIVAAVVGSFPATWLLMLFLGNLGATQVGFWGALPAGILLTFFFAGAGASSRSYMR